MLPSSLPRSILGVIASVTVLGLLAGCQSQSSQNQQQSGPPPLPDNELAIEDAWVHSASAGDTTGLYMTIANGRQTADTLVRARAPIVDSSDVQQITSGGSSVRPSLPIPARSRVTLSPDSVYVRLLHLGQSFDEGSNVILNLEFTQSGLQRVRVPVRSSPPTDE